MGSQVQVQPPALYDSDPAAEKVSFLTTVIIYTRLRNWSGNVFSIVTQYEILRSVRPGQI